MKAILFSLAVFCCACGRSQQGTQVAFHDKHVQYQGRIVYRDTCAELSWPGTSVTVRFDGKGLKATLRDQDTANYFNVIVDGQVTRKLHPDREKQVYVLADSLGVGPHTVTLFKRTEWDKGKTFFYGFEVMEQHKLLPPPPLPHRKLCFYGNSITCGYAMEDSSGSDSYYGYYENNYNSYAAITARHFNAQYQCVAKSGIGILVSWFPLIMPEMYDRADATDSTSKWDFNQYQPDVVVVNLLQNDSWLINMPNHEQFKARFGTQKPDSVTIVKAYKDFITKIRAAHPKATIICALGSMDATRVGAPWPGYITEAVKELHDGKMFTHFFPYKNTPGHPNTKEQAAMASDLIAFIDANVQW